MREANLDSQLWGKQLEVVSDHMMSHLGKEWSEPRCRDGNQCLSWTKYQHKIVKQGKTSSGGGITKGGWEKINRGKKTNSKYQTTENDRWGQKRSWTHVWARENSTGSQRGKGSAPRWTHVYSNIRICESSGTGHTQLGPDKPAQGSRIAAGVPCYLTLESQPRLSLTWKQERRVREGSHTDWTKPITLLLGSSSNAQ